MDLNLYITPKALKVLVRTVLSGPNCLKNIFLYDISKVKNNTNIKDIIKYFDKNFGPITTLINYAVSHYKNKKNYLIDFEDIVNCFCLNHINIVKAGFFKFKDEGFDQDYFKQLKENGFELNRKNVLRYFFSCIGKVGEVCKVYNNNFCKIKIVLNNHLVYLDNVYCLKNIKNNDLVAVHFATVIKKIDKVLYDEILKQQKEKNTLIMFNKIKRINYKKFLKSDLSVYTKKIFQKIKEV